MRILPNNHSLRVRRCSDRSHKYCQTNYSENHEVIVAAGEGDGKMWQMLHPDMKQE